MERFIAQAVRLFRVDAIKNVSLECVLKEHLASSGFIKCLLVDF
jgi:hypothetical protein